MNICMRDKRKYRFFSAAVRKQAAAPRGKLFFPAASAIVSALLFVSCASSKKTIDIADVSPAAVLTIASNERIGWLGTNGDDDSGGLLTGYLLKLSASANADKPSVIYNSTDKLLAYAEKCLREKLIAAGFSLVPAEDVFAVKTYAESRQNANVLRDDGNLAEGYRCFAPASKAVIKGVSAETGARSCVFALFKFNKELLSGDDMTGDIIPVVSVSLEFTDANASKICTLSGSASGSERLYSERGTYDYEKLFSFFPDLIDAAVIDCISGRFADDSFLTSYPAE